MRKSTTDKPLRMQQAMAYTYKGVDVYRSWVVMPTKAVIDLGLKKGDELYWEISGDRIYFWRKTSSNS